MLRCYFCKYKYNCKDELNVKRKNRKAYKEIKKDNERLHQIILELTLVNDAYEVELHKYQN